MFEVSYRYDLDLVDNNWVIFRKLPWARRSIVQTFKFNAWASANYYWRQYVRNHRTTTFWLWITDKIKKRLC